MLVCLVPIAFMVVRSFGRADPITLDVEMTGTIDSYRTAVLGDVPAGAAALGRPVAGAPWRMCLVVGYPRRLAMSRLAGSATAAGAGVGDAAVVRELHRADLRVAGVLATGGPIESITGAQLLFRPPAVLIGMITAYVPLFVLPAYVALMRVPPSLLDAAAISGRGHLRQLLTVTVPLARRGIVTGAVLVGVLSIGEFIVPSVLGAATVLLLGNILAERGAGRDQPLGGAITVFMLAVFASIGLIALLLSSGDHESARLNGVRRRDGASPTRSGRVHRSCWPCWWCSTGR